MVLKTELCRFSGAEIYPGRGIRFIRSDSQLGRALFNHLKVYKGPDHPHEAQKPLDLPIRDKRIQIRR